MDLLTAAAAASFVLGATLIVRARAARAAAAAAESGPDTSHLGLACRSHFLLDFSFTHLNHGSYGTAPRSVVAAALAELRGIEAFPDDFMRRRALQRYKATGDVVARLVNAPAGSVVLVENATTAVNAVLVSLDLRPGDQLLLLDQTYNACALAARGEAARRGCSVAVLPVALPAADADAVVADFSAALAAAVRGAPGGRARFILLDHIASATGMLFPIARLVAAARAHVDYVMVDGAHAPAMLELDLAALRADWYTGNLHKWAFAPKGVAFLHTRDELQAAQRPLVTSHLAHARDWRERFWMQGTADYSRALAVPAALDFMSRELGVAAMRAYNTRLCAAAAARLCARWGTAPLLPAALAAPFMRSLGTPLDYRRFVEPPLAAGASEAEAVAAALADAGLNERVAGAIFAASRVQGQFAFWVVGGRGGLYTRISAQVYNVMADFDRLGDAVLALAAASSAGDAAAAPRQW